MGACQAALTGGLLIFSTTAAGQTVARSPGPEAVAVTIYRNPDRPAGQRFNLGWLNGYALVTERRTVTLAPGENEIRFEGVAGNILPESALVTGLPDGVIEKNQDADLLSPASLIDRSLGRRVHLRRTSAATGEVREQDAVVRSGADGAVVVQTADGIEALRCTGLRETLVHDGVPEGLAAKPTLSVRTAGGSGGAATVTLSYLATGFDWQADYVATLNAAGDRLDLFAWVTLANGDETSFVRADTQTVAGKPNREQWQRRQRWVRPLNLQCWPQGTTSDVESYGEGNEEIVVTGHRMSMDAPPPPPPPAPMALAPPPAAMEAVQEDLGDLKLYRIPEPVTVASHSQKQVAMLQRPRVKVAQLFRSRIHGVTGQQRLSTVRIIKTRNRTAEGLGLPLPAGKIVLFGSGRERPVLLGRGAIDDHAVGEDVEIEVGEANGIATEMRVLAEPDERGDEIVLTVTNAQNRPVTYEAVLSGLGFSQGKALPRRNSGSVWQTTIPANGRKELRFRIGS